jgi:ABC-2 type transport system permease protein
MTAAVQTARRLSPSKSVGRALATAAAFLRIGYLSSISYPLGFFIEQLQGVVPAIVFFFVTDVFGDRASSPAVGGDYYTFAVIGIFSLQVISAGLRGFSAELDTALHRGNFEMLLVEPVRWRLLPFGMSLWPTVVGLFAGSIVLVVAALLGADFRWEGFLLAVPVIILGITAGLAVAILSGAIKILAKKGDPIIFLYSLSAQIFSGAYFPIDNLPGFLQPLRWLVPHTYAIDALRRVLMPGGDTVSGLTAGEAITGLLVFNLVLYPLGLWLFGRGMETGRKYGLLGGY